MTREEILKLPAGEALDVLVLEHVLGWRWYVHADPKRSYHPGMRYLAAVHHSPLSVPAIGEEPVASYTGHLLPVSTDIGAAWEVVRQVGGGDVWQIETSSEGTSVRLIERTVIFGTPDGAIELDGPDREAEAICKAALLAKLCCNHDQGEHNTVPGETSCRLCGCREYKGL